MYIVGKYIIYLYKLFYPVLQRVQINLIFNDNVRIMCLSCNIKKSKTSTKFSENNWSKLRSNGFQWCHLWRQCLYYYHFFLSLYMNQVPEMLY